MPNQSEDAMMNPSLMSHCFTLKLHNTIIECLRLCFSLFSISVGEIVCPGDHFLFVSLITKGFKQILMWTNLVRMASDILQQFCREIVIWLVERQKQSSKNRKKAYVCNCICCIVYVFNQINCGIYIWHLLIGHTFWYSRFNLSLRFMMRVLKQSPLGVNVILASLAKESS